MAQAMTRLLACVVLVLLVVVAEGQTNGPKNKKVKCQDGTSPCFHVDLYCPDDCPRDCEVDCASCKPICSVPPPPLYVHSPPPPVYRPPTSSPPPPPPTSKSPPPPPPTPTVSPPPPPTPTHSPPPPPTPTSSPPPPPTPILSPPPPPTPTVSPPPPPTPTVSPPPPPTPTLSPPPPPTPTSSPPPPPTPTLSPPPPPTPTLSPPPPPTPTSSPPPPPTPILSPPPPSTPTVSPPPPPTPTLSPPPPPTPTSSPPPPPTPTLSPPPPPTPTLSPPPPPTPTSSPPPTQSSPPPPTPSLSPPPPTPSPPPEVAGKKVYCKSSRYKRCYRIQHECPRACPGTCQVDCVTCSPVCSCDRSGAVCEDPRFIGADGITFYFHGKKDRDFCIVSDTNLHINAHFIGRRNQNMKRDFTWVQSLGILFDNHQISVGAKKTATWDDAVDRLDLAFDGQPIYLTNGDGAAWQPITTTGVSITRSRDTNSVTIEVQGNFQIQATVVPITKKDSWIHKYGVTDEDCFAHLDLSFKFYSLSGAVNGVLGQTYASNYVSRVKMGVNMPVLGGEKEFASSNLFSTDCEVARFQGTPSITTSLKSAEYSDLKCASGLDGRGVVCKR